MKTGEGRTALILPVRNAGKHLDRLLPALASQTLQPDEWLVVDSQSADDTAERFRKAGARVVVIPANRFNHGGTRRWATQLVTSDILIFMTQDAIPADPDCLRILRDSILADDQIGISYGRQLPHHGAGIIEAHSRQFNYPDKSLTKTLADSSRLGVKTCFSSDSFCAYRRTALDLVCGFPQHVIGSEDAYVAGRVLLAGLKVRYESHAKVFHSHSYSMVEEFRRYFDIGVFYGQQSWLEQSFGRAGGEGRRYVNSEIKAIFQAGQGGLLPECIIRTVLKLLGYKLGGLHRFLPLKLKQQISMFPLYWTVAEL